jgi:hypothetical protein
MNKNKPDLADSLGGPFPAAAKIRQLSDEQRVKLDQDYQHNLEKMRAILHACINWQLARAVDRGIRNLSFSNYTFSAERSAKTFFTRMDSAEDPLIRLADEPEALALWSPLEDELRTQGFTVKMTTRHRGQDIEAIFDLSW